MFNIEQFTDVRLPARKAKILLALISMLNFVQSTSFALMAPFFPHEAEDIKGLSAFEVGMVFAEFELIYCIVTPFMGYFIKQIGPKFMFKSGLVISGVSFIAFGTLEWCPSELYLAMCLTFRFIQAVGSAAISVSSMAILSYVFPDSVSTVLGALEGFSGLGNMAGPVVGGLLYQLGGFFLPFLICGVLILFNAFVAIFMLPKRIENRKFDTKIFRMFIALPDLIFIGVIFLSTAMSLAFLDPVLSDYLVEIEPNMRGKESLIGLVFSITSVLYAVSSPGVGYVTDKHGYGITISLVGSVLLVLTYLTIGPIPSSIEPSLVITGISLAFLGVGVAAAVIPLFSVLTNATKAAGLPDSVQTFGLISGFFGTCFSFGCFASPLIAGWLRDAVGFRRASAVFTIVPMVGVLALVAYLIFDKFRQPVEIIADEEVIDDDDDALPLIGCEEDVQCALESDIRSSIMSV